MSYSQICECESCSHDQAPCRIYNSPGSPTTCKEERASEDWCKGCQDDFASEWWALQAEELLALEERALEEKRALGYCRQ